MVSSNSSTTGFGLASPTTPPFLPFLPFPFFFEPDSTSPKRSGNCSSVRATYPAGTNSATLRASILNPAEAKELVFPSSVLGASDVA